MDPSAYAYLRPPNWILNKKDLSKSYNQISMSLDIDQTADSKENYFMLIIWNLRKKRNFKSLRMRLKKDNTNYQNGKNLNQVEQKKNAFIFT